MVDERIKQIDDKLGPECWEEGRPKAEGKRRVRDGGSTDRQLTKWYGKRESMLSSPDIEYRVCSVFPLHPVQERDHPPVVLAVSSFCLFSSLPYSGRELHAGKRFSLSARWIHVTHPASITSLPSSSCSISPLPTSSSGGTVSTIARNAEWRAACVMAKICCMT